MRLVDDLDPDVPADETVHFALDGRRYEIDLGRGHAAQLRVALQHYVAAARPLPATYTAGPAATAAISACKRTRIDIDRNAVRAWARETGRSVPERGSIPPTLYLEFRQATDV